MRAFLIRALLHAMALFPLPINHAIGTALGWLLYAIPNTLRRTVFTNLQLCFPELDHKALNRLARQSLIETGKTVTEMGPLWLWSPKRVLRLVRDIDNIELLQDALAHEKGVILLAPHLGAWEMVGLHYASARPITSLYRPPRIQSLENFVLRGRTRTGAHLVPANNTGVRSLLAALHANETTGILPDQNPGEKGGIIAPFFGVDTNSVVFVSKLIQKTGARVVLQYAERLSHGRGYRMHFRAPPDDIYSPDLLSSVSAMNLGVEKCARELPSQYQWTYKRFKTVKPGQPHRYQ